jgi:hypothetical protein
MGFKDSFRYDLDVLNGIAILVVALYRVGCCRSWYLGADNLAFALSPIDLQFVNGSWVLV